MDEEEKRRGIVMKRKEIRKDGKMERKGEVEVWERREKEMKRKRENVKIGTGGRIERRTKGRR